jgi:Hydrazine synthase alpha subunit middle domain
VRIGQAQAFTVRAGGANALQPILVRAHAVPKRHPSSLGDRVGANLLCLNAYTSRGGGIPEGVVAAVRVYAQDDAGASVALGQAPVEKDGSFYVQVPAERPIRFELLDRDSKTVRAERGWFWARRGEQRVCVGCHAGPERAPDNAVPAVLLRTTDPVKMVLPVHSEAVSQSRGARLPARQRADSACRARSVPASARSFSANGGNR